MRLSAQNSRHKNLLLLGVLSLALFLVKPSLGVGSPLLSRQEKTSTTHKLNPRKRGIKPGSRPKKSPRLFRLQTPSKYIQQRAALAPEIKGEALYTLGWAIFGMSLTVSSISWGVYCAGRNGCGTQQSWETPAIISTTTAIIGIGILVVGAVRYHSSQEELRQYYRSIATKPSAFSWEVKYDLESRQGQLSFSTRF